MASDNILTKGSQSTAHPSPSTSTSGADSSKANAMLSPATLRNNTASSDIAMRAPDLPAMIAWSRLQILKENPTLFTRLYGSYEQAPSPPSPPTILDVTPGPKRVAVSFTDPGVQSFVLRLHNVGSGKVREVKDVTRSPYTWWNLCNGETYTISIAGKFNGRVQEFSTPSQPFVPGG